MESRVNRIRLAAWASLVLAISALNYAARFTSSSPSARSGRDEVYSWSAFAGGMIVYGIWFAIVLAIAVDRHDLLALRRPRSWGRAAGLCVGAIAAIYAVSAVVSVLPLPQSPSHEQGIAPTHWEPRYAGAFAANVVLFTVIAPIVEELMFRGLGQSLLSFLGRWPSILVVGLAFGATHGLLEALLILVPFGVALAYVRNRTDSVYPGMVVHALFNGAALAFSVL
jgi:membrane protease YdiL (CAAX protease family)